MDGRLGTDDGFEDDRRLLGTAAQVVELEPERSGACTLGRQVRKQGAAARDECVDGVGAAARSKPTPVRATPCAWRAWSAAWGMTIWGTPWMISAWVVPAPPWWMAARVVRAARR